MDQVEDPAGNRLVDLAKTACHGSPMKAADFLPDARDKATIIIAELPDGRQFKLTGYSRTAIWARSPEVAPTHVNVIVVPVASADEIARLHDEFEQLLSEDMM